MPKDISALALLPVRARTSGLIGHSGESQKISTVARSRLPISTVNRHAPVRIDHPVLDLHFRASE